MTAATAPAATTAPPRYRRSDGILMGTLGMICFSGTVPATRVAAPVFGSTTLTFARIVIAATLGIVTLAARRQLRPVPIQAIPQLIVMGLGLAVGYPLLLALGVERVPAYHGAVVIGLTPAVTAVIAALRAHERLPPLFWIGSLTGLTAVLTFAITQGGGRLHAPDGWLALAVLACSIGYVEGGRAARNLGGTAALSWAMILLLPLAVVALPFSIATHPVTHVNASAWIGFWYVGIFSMFLGSVAWYRGLATGGIARIGQLNLAQPFLAVAWSVLLLHETITPAVPVTAAIVIACMALCINSGRASKS